ncbi:hypothetical protein GGR24_000494 [Hansschlegelia beijingensis]|uniref:Uncharacterized protein n=1 Tax=Hansschlegelia beijingensis TaxID=1133344 RepID=A0A7W6CZD2_9HYPH|nr:hypothetical protein [Hansschlegelia beijingensis]
MLLKYLFAAAIVALTATSSMAVDRPDRLDASTMDRRMGPAGRTANDGAASQSPGTIGAMHYATAGLAANSAAVRGESRGRLTAVHAAWRAAQ